MPIHSLKRRTLCCAMATVAIAASSDTLAGQTAPDLPFAPGERLVFSLRTSRLGTVGTGTLSVEGPETVRDVEAYVLRFNLKARVGFISAADRTASWIDPHRMASLRFQKHERHPLSKHDENVELYPLDQRWQRSPSDTGVSPTDDPLDELSFIYFVRTLALDVDATYELHRHFEAGRNPIRVTVVRRDTLTTPAGTFPTVLVELRVRDPRRYRGEGVIAIHLSDDRYRIPVRITSSMPMLGSTILTLTSHSYPAAYAASSAH